VAHGNIYILIYDAITNAIVWKGEFLRYPTIKVVSYAYKEAEELKALGLSGDYHIETHWRSCENREDITIPQGKDPDQIVAMLVALVAKIYDKEPDPSVKQ